MIQFDDMVQGGGAGRGVLIQMWEEEQEERTLLISLGVRGRWDSRGTWKATGEPGPQVRATTLHSMSKGGTDWPISK